MSSGVLRGLAGDLNNLGNAEKKAAQASMMRGQALMAVGAGIAAVGIAGLAFFGKATADAIEYNKQVALTKTQMYGVKASLDDVAKAGLDVARNVAVPLDQIQAGLYDIFSSMDVNMSQAKFLLSNFAKEAVAGQVDLSTAERASIGIMNAYQMKVTDVTKVQDIMFNLVKYGVGTYGDFANAIGRVTGPAVRENQTFEQTAALMAFVTRNGLSASNAASSVGRALDAIGKSRDKIQNFGQIVTSVLGDKTAAKLGITADSMIKVVDASGKMLPINQIMTQLGVALKNLNPTQQNDVLTAMFKGTGGTIQAMRFFDIAIHNFGQLNNLVKEMGNSKGALKAAYDTMANTPAMKIQLLKNNFHALMIEIGDVFIPIVTKLVIAFTAIFSWIGKLNPTILKWGAIILAIISVLAVLVGILVAVAGAWLILSTIMAASEIALAPLIVTILAVIAVIALLAFGAYEIYNHWGPISKWFHNMWFDMYHWIDHIWQMIWKAISAAWGKVKAVFKDIQNWVSSNFDKWWKTHGSALEAVWNTVWGNISSVFSTTWGFIYSVMKTAFNLIETLFKIEFNTLFLGVKVFWSVVEGVFSIAWAILVAGWKIFWNILLAYFKFVWATMIFALKLAWDTIVVVFSVFLDILSGHWHQAWVDIYAYVRQVWNLIKGFLVTIWHIIEAAAGGIFGAIEQLFFGVWHSIYNTAHGVWQSIWSYLQSIWGDIKGGAKQFVKDLGGIWNAIEGAFKGPVDWVIKYVYDDGIRALWNTVVNAIGLGKIDMPFVKQFSSGGRLGGFGGGDIIPALLEPGEAVVDKHRTRKYAALFAMMGIKGFASGGVPGPVSPIQARVGPGANISGPALGPLQGLFNLTGAAGKMMLAAATGNSTAFINALTSVAGGSSGAGGNLAAMVATLPVALMKHVVGKVWSMITGGASRATTSVGAGPGGGSVAQNQALARALMPGWATGSMWSDWRALWNQESGWSQFAYNAGSGATGIPQALPFTKMPRAAWLPFQGGSANVRAQESWGINYISGRYGNPANAWAHELGFNWYGNGLNAVVSRPTMIGVGEHGAEHVQVTPLGKGGHGPTQNFFITTNEINPRMHAAQLGFELARRSG
jgi:TP901 family phage tail tape measure protein